MYRLIVKALIDGIYECFYFYLKIKIKMEKNRTKYFLKRIYYIKIFKAYCMAINLNYIGG